MGASTIVVAREDLSIPGAAEPGNGNGSATGTADAEARFFNVVRQHNPDVVVLDLSESQGHGIGAILKIRRRSGVPILVVCDADDAQIHEYRLAGAAECIETPVDLMRLNRTVQHIIRLAQHSHWTTAPGSPPTQSVCFSGLTLHPHDNTLIGADGASAKLTTSENRVLLHFTSNPWTLCTRDSLAEALYGTQRPSSERAVDVIVTRLRKKIAALGGPDAQHLIKTEFRRGYVFVAEVSAPAAAAVAARANPPLQARRA